VDSGTAVSDAEQFRTVMVDRLYSRRPAVSAAVEAAMRSLGRHLFLPAVPLAEAYSGGAVVTHRDPDGIAVSSASAPGVVAWMLEQLDVQPGHRILEIGAGTGYNAALLASLAGAEVTVTTVDIDAGVAAAARKHLTAAGAANVTVICGDGQLGVPEHAPYDRIIVTAGAWDLPPAWASQLAPGGRLVVPLRMRGFTRSVAFTRQDGYWLSQSMSELGFMPMRGADAMPERNLRLGQHSDIVLRVDDRQAADALALSAAVDHPAALAWTGVSLPESGTGDLDFWLAGIAGFARLLVTSPDAIARGFTAPVYDWGSMAIFEHGSLAYLTERPGAGVLPELGVCAYGPGATALAERAAGQVRAWDRDRRQISRLWIEAHPAGCGDAPGDLMVVDKQHTRVVVRTAPAAVPSK
jgi:protein-L-isoaspartate(D-aspartate) O-methyltransferase